MPKCLWVASGRRGGWSLGYPVGARHGGEAWGRMGKACRQLPLSPASLQRHPACSSEQKVRGRESEEEVFISSSPWCWENSFVYTVEWGVPCSHRPAVNRESHQQCWCPICSIYPPSHVLHGPHPNSTTLASVDQMTLCCHLPRSPSHSKAGEACHYPALQTSS